MESETTQRRSLVVQVWLNRTGQMEGQVRDPLSGWQQDFAAPDELWRIIVLLCPTPLTSDHAESQSDSKE